jgi:hypothetical protein
MINFQPVPAGFACVDGISHGRRWFQSLKKPEKICLTQYPPISLKNYPNKSKVILINLDDE